MALKLKDITAGNTRVINLSFTDESGIPLDLTGATVTLTATDGTNTITKTTTSHVVPALGTSKLTLSTTDTNVPAGVYNFGVQAVLSNGTVVENTGTLKIKPQYVA